MPTETNDDPVTDAAARAGWLATPGRRRMAAVGASAAVFNLVFVGYDVVLPLWVTRDLGYSAAEFAHLRSLRFAGAAIGAIVLGALSDRFGQRALAVAAMLGTAGVFAVMAAGAREGVWVAMPFLGAFASTVFLNVNGLTQMISGRRQGVANSAYRSILAAAGVVAPPLCTWLAVRWSGYPPVLALFAGLMVLSAAALWAYPSDGRPAAFRGWRGELAAIVRTYRAPLGQRDLMRYGHLSQIWFAIVMGTGGFAAIRISRELGRGDEAFGLVAAAGGALAFAVTTASAFVVDRVPLRAQHVGLSLVASGAVLAMGLTDRFAVTAIAFVAFVPAASLVTVPMSIWVARAARPGEPGGCSLASAFAMHKLLTAAYAAAAMWLLGVLEGAVGIRSVFLITGVLAAAWSCTIWFLPEPPRGPALPID